MNLKFIPNEKKYYLLPITFTVTFVTIIILIATMMTAGRFLIICNDVMYTACYRWEIQTNLDTSLFTILIISTILSVILSAIILLKAKLKPIKFLLVYVVSLVIFYGAIIYYGFFTKNYPAPRDLEARKYLQDFLIASLAQAEVLLFFKRGPVLYKLLPVFLIIIAMGFIYLSDVLVRTLF